MIYREFVELIHDPGVMLLLAVATFIATFFTLCLIDKFKDR